MFEIKKPNTRSYSNLNEMTNDISPGAVKPVKKLDPNWVSNSQTAERRRIDRLRNESLNKKPVDIYAPK